MTVHRQSGAPDQNYKPSTILWDSTNDAPFAWEGSSSLGSAYVQVVDNSGTPIVSFGGGTQYKDGDTPPANPTGTTIEWSDGSHWQTVSTAKPLPVTANLITGFALESGGNLDAIETDLDTLVANSPVLGQALASASIPVILPSATITTLTPPSNTGYALDSSLSTINTSLANVATLGAKTDAKSTATDGTSVSIMQVLKEISAMEQAPASRAVTNTGTFAVQATLQASSGTDIGKLTANQSVNLAQVGGTNTVNGGLAGSLAIGGTVGNNVAPTGNPVPLAGIAVSSEPSANTATRISQLITDLVGKLIVLPYANPENFVSGRASATDTTSTSLIAAPASGLRNYITQFTVWNSSAVSTYVKIQDGSGGTEIYDIPAPAGGGATLTLPTPLRQPTTATALYFAANASANAIVISASGYKGA